MQCMESPIRLHLWLGRRRPCRKRRSQRILANQRHDSSHCHVAPRHSQQLHQSKCTMPGLQCAGLFLSVPGWRPSLLRRLGAAMAEASLHRQVDSGARDDLRAYSNHIKQEVQMAGRGLDATRPCHLGEGEVNRLSHQYPRRFPCFPEMQQCSAAQAAAHFLPSENRQIGKDSQSVLVGLRSPAIQVS